MEESITLRNYRLLNKSPVSSRQNNNNNNHNGVHHPTLSLSSFVTSDVQNLNPNLPEDLFNLDQDFRNLTLSKRIEDPPPLFSTFDSSRAGLMMGDSSSLTFDSFNSVLPQALGYPPPLFDNAFYAASPVAGGLNSSTVFTRTDNSNNSNGLINYSGEFADYYFTNGYWNPLSQQGYYFMLLEQCKGKIHLIAKEQRGCKFLQKILEIGNIQEILMIYSEIVVHVVELMKDPFANYLIQKFYAICEPDQITQLLVRVISGRFSLIELCQNNHGTRAMQKLIDFLTTHQQRTLLVSALAYITVPLVKSLNGSHVIQHCLKRLPIQYTKHILNVVAENCLRIATDRCGCRVLQQCIFICITQAERESGNRILADIISNALFLSQDHYGNYVVQSIIGKGLPQVTNGIIDQLRGRFVSLSMDKHGSNVVEKCMKESSEEEAIRIIVEIIYDVNFMTVVQDAFGNYVAQSALAIAKGPLQQKMVNIIQRNSSSLHNNPHGKRILAKARALKK